MDFVSHLREMDMCVLGCVHRKSCRFPDWAVFCEKKIFEALLLDLNWRVLGKVDGYTAGIPPDYVVFDEMTSLESPLLILCVFECVDGHNVR